MIDAYKISASDLVPRFWQRFPNQTKAGEAIYALEADPETTSFFLVNPSGKVHYYYSLPGGFGFDPVKSLEPVT